jgi:hypothetical protein
VTALADRLAEIAADQSWHVLDRAAACDNAARYLLPTDLSDRAIRNALRRQRRGMVEQYPPGTPSDLPSILRHLALRGGLDVMGERYDALNAPGANREALVAGMDEHVVEVTAEEIIQRDRRHLVRDIVMFGGPVRVRVEYVGDLAELPEWLRWLTGSGQVAS